MKIDQEDFNRKAQHIIDTVVKPQVEKYERAKAIEQAAANLADPNVDKTENWIAGAKYESERMHSVLVEMFATLKQNAVDNISTIHNVDLFIKGWTREFKNKQQEQ
jgi:hypothetical protein